LHRIPRIAALPEALPPPDADPLSIYPAQSFCAVHFLASFLPKPLRFRIELLLSLVSPVRVAFRIVPALTTGSALLLKETHDV
jgi:hypothetical protein